MLVVGCLLWRHAVSLMRLTVHALLASGPAAKRSAPIATVAATIPKLRIMCEILFIISTDIVKHGTLPTVRMGTYLLVHIGRKVRARVVRVAIWVRGMLASTLSLSLLLLLLLLQHLVSLLWLVRLLLARNSGIWGGVTASRCFTCLAVSSLGVLLDLIGGVMRTLFSGRGDKSTSHSLLRRACFLRVLL